jgi:hypothetical protein
MDIPKHNKVELPLSTTRRPVVDSVVSPVADLSLRQKLNQQAKKPDYKFPVLVYSVLILAILVGAYVLFTGPFSKLTQAVLPASASEATSVLYAYPLTIQADGSTQSKIDIFVSSDDLLPLANKKVTITTTAGMANPTTAMTDKMGHASYSLVMSEPGIATINFAVDDVPFSKQITIKGE